MCSSSRLMSGVRGGGTFRRDVGRALHCGELAVEGVLAFGWLRYVDPIPTYYPEVEVTDFLAEKRNEINDRLAELKPLVAEAQRLEEAAAALAGIPAASNGASATPGAPARRRGRPPGRAAAAKPTTTRKAAAKPAGQRRGAGRRKGSGKRSAEALSIIQGQPGIAIPEIAARMGIKQNYLYRILPDLEKSGAVRKEKRGWHPVAAKAAA